MVYFGDCGSASDFYLLQGDYQSEGRNVLEAHCVYPQKGCDDNALAGMVKRFSDKAVAVIGQTYAMKLMRFEE